MVRPEFLEYMKKSVVDSEYDYEKDEAERRTFQIYSLEKNLGRIGIVKATYLDDNEVSDQRLISWINGEDDTVKDPKSQGMRLITLNFKLDETSKESEVKKIREADISKLFLYQ